MSGKSQEFGRVVNDLLASLSTFDTWMKTQDWDVYSTSSSHGILECSNLLKSVGHSLSNSLHSVNIAVNTTAPINRLPVDVLRSILVWLSPPRLEGFLPPVEYMPWVEDAQSPQRHMYRWLRIVSVCRHWREVALSSPTLWSTIAIGPTYTPSQIIDLQLQVTGTAPIDLHSWVQSSQPEVLRRKRLDWNIFDIRHLIPRLRSFHLHIGHINEGAERLFKQITRPAPWLQHLSITPVGFLETESPVAIIEGEPLARHLVLPKLFSDEMPRLQSLTISFFISWPENHFRNLVRICLNDQLSRPNNQVETWSRSFLFNFLNDSPRLEELVLSNSLPLTDDGSTHALNLPRLKVIAVSWDAISTTLLLSALKIPPSCLVNLTPVSPGLTFLSAVCAAPALNNMSVYLERLTRLYFRFTYNPIILACGEGSGLYLKASLQWLNPNEYVTVPVSIETMHFYSAMHIEELWIEIDDGISLPPFPRWSQFYEAMPNVSKLVITTKCVQGSRIEHLEVLCGEVGFSRYFPRLAELHFIYVGGITPEPLIILKRIQSDRAAHGTPIRKLVVGARPPVVLYEETMLDIYEKLGPQVVCETTEVSFDWSPFANRTPYGRPYWPEQLYGDTPGLWSNFAREF